MDLVRCLVRAPSMRHSASHSKLRLSLSSGTFVVRLQLYSKLDDELVICDL